MLDFSQNENQEGTRTGLVSVCQNSSQNSIFALISDKEKLINTDSIIISKSWFK